MGMPMIIQFNYNYGHVKRGLWGAANARRLDATERVLPYPIVAAQVVAAGREA
jgi:hypothetical protein